jgi:hypothetical protein
MSKWVKAVASDVLGQSTATYAVKYNAVDATTAYSGKAIPGTATSAASWLIQKLTFNAGGDVTIQYANGADTFVNIWDNRASLSYS